MRFCLKLFNQHEWDNGSEVLAQVGKFQKKGIEYNIAIKKIKQVYTC